MNLSLAPPLDPVRESLGLAIGWLAKDEEIVETIAARYGLNGTQLALLLGVLNVYGRSSADELGDELFERALALASAP